MKRIYAMLFVVLSCIFVFNTNVFAANLTVTSNFPTLVSDATYRSETVNGKTEYVMLFTISTEDDFYNYFPSSSPVAELIGTGDISITPYADWILGASYRGQCVGLVKVGTNNASGVTSSWGKGPAFNPSSPPAQGTVLAFFNGKTTYPSDGSGHVLVYWGTAGTGQFLVVDQNWSYDKRIRKHIISGSSGTGRNNLSNYNIVTK